MILEPNQRTAIQERKMKTNLLLAAACSVAAVASADPLDHWALRNAGTNTLLNGVTWGRGTYVAVGSFGPVLTSPDEVAWTQHSDGSPNDFCPSLPKVHFDLFDTIATSSD